MTAATGSLADCAQAAHDAEVADLVGPDDVWLSTTEAAAVLGCSKTHVINLVDRGELPATRVGNRRRILRKVVEDRRDQMIREAAGE
jgi:excisionase family DNA binding protein